MESKISSLKIIDQQTAQLNSNYIQLNSQFCRTVIDFLFTQPQAYYNYEQDEKIPQAKHKQLEMYLYGLENNNHQIQQADQLIYELFNKFVHILKENIEKQETDLQNLSTSIRVAKENILSRDYNELASISDDYLRRYENNEDENNLLTNLFNGDNGNNIAELIVKSVLLSISIWLKLYPVIKRIVKLYPQLIVHPFKLSYETLQYSIQDPILKHNLELIQQQLNRYILLVNEFIEALNQLNPQQQFDIWSKELFHLLTNDVNTKDIDKLKEHLIKLKNILFSNIINLDETNDEQSMLSNTQDNNNDIDNTLLKPKITSIRILFKNACEKEFNDLFGKNGELLSTISLGDTRLILDKSSIHELEIPEQYTSKKKPLIEHHIKIVGFDEKLLVLDSLRLPKRITIRGHDENNYRFLVKAGEDIRQDQRIEALFSIMNDLYDNDPNYNQSNSAHIAVRTYKVIPMSSKFGMIEWLDNIRPLKDLIEESYNDSELDIITNQGQHPRKT
ncbi:unnamed protein product [Rotaria magnacalcarata]|uniref:PI3K/PI4K catalytic domain-containing protein n=1 Tax=Rotaria magnacalcarata TaxID=392030 RepID=A0A816WKM2_9BILA|nr:unnamed protein product [Rotaria magnacalcarata]